MDEPTTSPIRCSGCRSTAFSADPDGVPICDYCGAPYAPPVAQCPRCGSAYDPGACLCASCDAVLTRTCPVCEALNPLAARHCLVCGHTLDVTDAMFARLTMKTSDKLRRVRRTGAEIKSDEETASRARLAKMWAAESRRRQEQARAQARRARQERLLVALAIGLLVVAILIAIIIATMVGNSTPTPLF